VSTVLMLGSTAVLLALLFPPFYCFFLAPVALVPLTLCVLRRPMTWRYLLAYYLTGVGFFLPNLFWLAPVTGMGLVGLAMYVALYVALYAVGMHRLVVQMRLPAALAAPVVWTAVEYIRSTFVLGGFPWFMLGNSLTPVPALIQGADLFGVWGVTFMVAMWNGLFVDVLRLPLYVKVAGSERKGEKTRFSPVIVRLVAAVCALTVGWVTYGILRLTETDTKPGPLVTVIQENIPQSMKDADFDATLLRHFRLSEEAVSADPKPDLVVWPETMITAPINQELMEDVSAKIETTNELKRILDALAAREQDEMKEAQKITDPKARDDAEAMAEARRWWGRIPYVYRALNDQVETHKVPLLLGYSSYEPVTADRPSKRQNRALLLVPGPTEAKRAGEYSKRHLVPFGEYLPFRGVPVLSRLMPLFSPINYRNSSVPGDAWTRFELSVSKRGVDSTGAIVSSLRRYEFGTPICFEDTMPEPAREMARIGGRKADFLVNMSNDGWYDFVESKDRGIGDVAWNVVCWLYNPIWKGVELDQHLQACQMRAVENRVAVARSVNTGDSGFIDSCGRIVQLVRDRAGNSVGAVGMATRVMPIDARETLFSRIGDIFPIICGVLATLLVGWTFVRPRRAGSPAASAARESP
jgi:apolipoprotein N-acyltransferase